MLPNMESSPFGRAAERSEAERTSHMLAITAMMLCQLLFRAAGTAGRLRRAGALVLAEAAAFMAVRGTVG